MKNVYLYILSDGLHPNNYEHTISETVKIMDIHEDEFDRLFLYINKEGAYPMRLAKAILEKSEVVGIDPYKDPFKPGDLCLGAGKYGSFSDWCKKEDTISAKHNRNVCLKAVEYDNGGHPVKYLLLPENQWVYSS